MREIIFKAKAENIDGTKDWVVGYLSKCDNKFIICDDDGIGIFVDPETICQYTELTDKNGNKIWENDVVDIQHYAEKAHKVKWGYGGFYVGINGLLCHYNTVCEVIGNIFDNADLLKGE